MLRSIHPTRRFIARYPGSVLYSFAGETGKNLDADDVYRINPAPASLRARITRKSPPNRQRVVVFSPICLFRTRKPKNLRRLLPQIPLGKYIFSFRRARIAFSSKWIVNELRNAIYPKPLARQIESRAGRYPANHFT